MVSRTVEQIPGVGVKKTGNPCPVCNDVIVTLLTSLLKSGFVSCHLLELTWQCIENRMILYTMKKEHTDAEAARVANY